MISLCYDFTGRWIVTKVPLLFHNSHIPSLLKDRAMCNEIGQHSFLLESFQMLDTHLILYVENIYCKFHVAEDSHWVFHKNRKCSLYPFW